MRIIQTGDRKPGDYDPWTNDQIYNGLDCCVTREVYDVISTQLDAYTAATYKFSRELQGPVLEMKLRGVLVDQARRAQVIDECFDKLDLLQRNLERIVLDGVGMEHFNWGSTKDLKELFYGKLGVPEIRSKGHVSTDATALEKMEAYLVARQIVRHILAMRELAKRIAVLRASLDPDGRIRTSYNIAGTNTGRFSSSLSEFGTGGNLQNIEESLRSIFVADPGMKFAKFDAKSGESYVVGAIEWNLFGDETYLDAIESGDIHITVAKIVWPDAGWTGDRAIDKKIAGRRFYRHHTYRDVCKKLGHGSSYGGQPFTLATQSRIPVSIVQQFQPKYFTAFPAHQRWQAWVADELLRRGHLITLTGRKRWFHGRRNDASTIREAIAYNPQGSLADIVNRAMLRIWRARTAILMAQEHDALVFMYPEEAEAEVIAKLTPQLIEPIPLTAGRELRIPYDCKVGWNKAEYDEKTNPDGLRDYTAGEEHRRRTPQAGILDRAVRLLHRQSRVPSPIS